MNQVTLPEVQLAHQLFMAEHNVGFGDGHQQYAVLHRLRYVVGLHVTGELPGHDPEGLLREVVDRMINHAYRDRAMTILMRIYRQATRQAS
jgi:hypothetical protein